MGGSQFPGRARSRARGAGSGHLGIGLATLYLSVIVLIPLAAVAVKALRPEPLELLAVGDQRDGPAGAGGDARRLAAGGVDRCRDGHDRRLGARPRRVPGQADRQRAIDLPFALPTIVAGLTLLALYGPDSPFGIHIAFTRGVVLVALLFVTLPFVVRSVQPVLLELDHEVEEAAASLGASNWITFRRVILPALRPAILSGAALAFARSVGEIGSLVLIVGKVQIASFVIFADIESDAPRAAASLSLVLIVLSLLVLVAIRRLGGRVAH